MKRNAITRAIIYIISIGLLITLFHFRVIGIVGGSMEPTIHDRSFVICQAKMSYEVGDIVAFTIERENIAHRIIKKVSSGGYVWYYTQGDANNKPDELPIYRQNIKCKVLGK